MGNARRPAAPVAVSLMIVCVCPAVQVDAKRRKDLESVVKVLAKAMAAVERARQVRVCT